MKWRVYLYDNLSVQFSKEIFVIAGSNTPSDDGNIGEDLQHLGTWGHGLLVDFPSTVNVLGEAIRVPVRLHVLQHVIFEVHLRWKLLDICPFCRSRDADAIGGVFGLTG